MDARHRAMTRAVEFLGRPSTLVASAPGRINLIGEHTDHQEGFVLPLALERRTWIAFSSDDPTRVRARADDLDRVASFPLDDLQPRPRAWSNYLIGVAWAARQRGLVPRGWQGVIASDVPRGAALSSSAALEVAAGLAFLGEQDPVTLALIGQQAENGWVGVNSGIMDQLVSAAAEAGSALFIDCRDLTYRPVAIPGTTKVVVMDTATRRGLVDSEYNDRRAACERVARAAGAEVLRDVTLDDLEELDLDPVDRRRAHHVISENERVLAAVATDDPEALGALMNESHRSLAEDFAVSTEALNTMVDLARAHDGCYGARMSGGGFGGAAVALVDASVADGFVTDVATAYREATGLTPNVFATEPGPGARLEATTT